MEKVAVFLNINNIPKENIISIIWTQNQITKWDKGYVELLYVIPNEDESVSK